MEIVEFRNWKFEVDIDLTKETYSKVDIGGADACHCNDCKNYVTYRKQIFPEQVKELFLNLGIDYKKEVEVISYEILPNGLHHIGGWFHFKGKIIRGKDCKTPIENKGFTFDLTDIGNNFLIGFCKHNSLTFFKDKEDLIQIEFEANIPWVID